MGNVYILEEKNGVGDSDRSYVGNGDHPDGYLGCDSTEIVRLEDEGEVIHISAGDQGITLTPRQVNALDSLIDVMWRERDV